MIEQAAPAVRRALAVLPHSPGVYLLRDQTGRVIYVGRSRDLAARVRSYWGHLGDRPHLVRMVRRVAWIEPVLCESEHEAAFLEEDLLARHPTRFNRTLGMESCVWLRLDRNPRAPDLTVVHDPTPADGCLWFGPYLGWEPARQAAAGLRRLFPLRYSGSDLDRSDRELARSLGVTPGMSASLATEIARVLNRDASATRSALRSLEQLQRRAARLLMFEVAAAVREQIRGLGWITEPQKLGLLDAIDADFAGAAGSARVVLSLRRGRLAQRHFNPNAGQSSDRSPVGGAWTDLARSNARLMSRLWSAGALGPLGWRPLAQQR